MFLVIQVELLGVRSLPFAVGSYIPIATTLAIFCGGFVRWCIEKVQTKEEKDAGEIGPGPLFASGLIAGGGIFGLLGIVVALLEDPEFPYHILPPNLFQIGPKPPRPPHREQRFRRTALRPASRRAILLRPQKTRLMLN